MQRTPVLISFLLIRLHRNIQIGFSEPRHRPQNLLPRSHQQTIAGRSPLCQFLRGGEFVPRNHSRCSPLQCHRNHQNHHNHDGRPRQRPHSPPPPALSFARRCHQHSLPEICRWLQSPTHHRQQCVHPPLAATNVLQIF